MSKYKPTGIAVYIDWESMIKQLKKKNITMSAASCALGAGHDYLSRMRREGRCIHDSEVIKLNVIYGINIPIIADPEDASFEDQKKADTKKESEKGSSVEKAPTMEIFSECEVLTKTYLLEFIKILRHDLKTLMLDLDIIITNISGGKMIDNK